MKAAIRKELGKPLARWGFTALAIVAATQAMLICGAVAYTAWEVKRS